MPLQSPPRKVSETENMLRLLLCVDTLESVTPAQLWTFVAEQDLMDYVSMRLCLHQLLAAGELETGEGAMKEQLVVTDRGREALTLFGERLPTEVRRRVELAAPAFRGRISRTRQIRAAYEMARPEDYRLNLSVWDGDLPTVTLRMATDSRTLASNALRSFEAHAAEVTTYLYRLAEAALQNAAPAQPSEADAFIPPDAIREHSAAEVTARVMLVGRKARFSAELLLPSRRAAEALIRAMEPQPESEAAAAKLTEILGKPLRARKR